MRHPPPQDEGEWRKRTFAELLGGASYILIDNVDDVLESASLAMTLTAPTVVDRLLGESRTVTVAQRATWVCTGNNIRLGGDIPARSYWCRLDAQTSRPERRTGFRHDDLKAYATERRGDLLNALLTLGRAWFAAGRPVPDIPPLGGFTQWQETIGGVLSLAGVPEFLRNLDDLYDVSDPETEAWTGFLLAWREVFGDNPATVREVVAATGTVPTLLDVMPEEVMAKGGGGPDPVALGKALGRRRGKRHGADDLRLERAGTHKRAVRWTVKQG